MNQHQKPGNLGQGNAGRGAMLYSGYGRGGPPPHHPVNVGRGSFNGSNRVDAGSASSYHQMNNPSQASANANAWFAGLRKGQMARPNTDSNFVYDGILHQLQVGIILLISVYS